MKIRRILALLTLLALPTLASAKKFDNFDLSLAWLDELQLDHGFFQRPILIPNGGPTSGSLSTQANSNWTTAPWMITAGPGAFPTGGGVATFLEQINTTVGVHAGIPIITVDTPITLSGMTFDSSYQWQVSGAAGMLSLSSTGPNTINVVNSNRSSLTLFAAGDVIAAAIGGGGAFGLTKIGDGIITMAGTNTYTGGTHINGGVLRITTGDAALGAAGAGNDVDINNAVLRVSTTVLTTARNFALTGNAVIELFANATINGIVSGSGNLVHNVGSTLTLSAANTYVGSTRQEAGTLIINGGNGSIASSSGYDIAGTMTLDNAAANNNDRLNNNGAVASRGAIITMSGNAAS
jgi:autotransporter-associated beta strand protein